MNMLTIALPGLYVLALAAIAYFALARWFESVPGRVIAVHAILVALILGPHLFLGRTLLPVSNLRACSVFSFVPDTSASENPLHDDLLVQMLPTMQAMRAALLAGTLPFRDDSMGGGVPLWGDQQAQAMQPVMLVSLVFEPERALVVVAALRLLLALTFSFLFLRSECGSAWGALAGSIAFGLGGFVQLWLGWPLANSAAWLPVVLWGVRRVSASGRRRDIALLVAATFGLLTSGHPETIAYAFGFSIAYAALELSRVSADRRRPFAIAVVASLAIGASLTAPMNVPSLRAIASSERSMLLSHRDEMRERGANAPVAQPDRLASVLAPDAYGNDRFGRYWGDGNINEDGSAYAGTAAFLLALLALTRCPRDRTVMALAAALLLCLLVISAAGPFGWLARIVPILSASSSGGHRLVLLVNWLVAWLAAIAVSSGERDRFGAVPLGLAALVLAISIAAIYERTGPAEMPVALEARRSTMLAVQLGALAIASVAARLRSRRIASAIIVVTLAAELALAHGPATPPARAVLPPSTPLLAALRGKAAEWRVLASRSALRPNLGSLYGIRQISVYNPIAPASWFLIVVDLPRNDVDDGIRRDADAWLDALGVRYLLLPRSDARASTSTLLVEDRSAVVERPGARPLFRFARDASVAPEGSLVDLLYLPPGEGTKAIARHAASIRGRKTSWLLADPPRDDGVYVADAGFWSDDWVPAEGDTIEPLSRSASSLAFAVRARGPRLLATTEIDDGGWTARIDGRNAPMEKLNGAFAGVRIPAGASRVELRYRPPGLAAGIVVGLVALLALAGWLLVPPGSRLSPGGAVASHPSLRQNP